MSDRLHAALVGLGFGAVMIAVFGVAAAIFGAGWYIVAAVGYPGLGAIGGAVLLLLLFPVLLFTAFGVE